MLDTLRLVSSEDVGRDEANVQSLLKKHKEVFITLMLNMVKLFILTTYKLFFNVHR